MRETEETVWDAREYEGLTFVVWKGDQKRPLTNDEMWRLRWVGRHLGTNAAPRVLPRKVVRVLREHLRKLSWAGIRVIGRTSDVLEYARQQEAEGAG